MTVDLDSDLLLAKPLSSLVVPEGAAGYVVFSVAKLYNTLSLSLPFSLSLSLYIYIYIHIYIYMYVNPQRHGPMTSRHKPAYSKINKVQEHEPDHMQS